MRKRGAEIEYDKILPEGELMSQLFKGFNFLFVPNNRARVTEIRKALARSHGAVINSKFRPTITSHILVDKVIIQTPIQILRALNVTKKSDIAGLPVLNQTWILDSVHKNILLNYDDYEIDIPDDLDVNAAKRKRDNSSKVLAAASSSPKKGREVFEDSINSPSIDENPNAETMQMLTQMADECVIKGDPFRAKAYRNAVNSLSQSREYITSSSEALKLPGVGKSIASKIEEITSTHHLSALTDLQSSETSKLLKTFLDIYGVGHVIAQKWIAEGARSIKDVAARTDLTHYQRLGIEYYDDWNQKIPRDECTAHKQYLEEIVKDIDPEVEFTIGGSYRRGASECGDIDFIVTKPDAEIEDLRIILNELLDKIKETGYHICSLTINVNSKWMGGCALPPNYLKMIGKNSFWGKCRRVDFLLVPWRQRGAAFIYFTGNDLFNMNIRQRALKRGMVLNEEGLYKKVSGENGDEKKELIESFDERKIFEFLGVKWREPTERNIGTNAIAKPGRKLGTGKKEDTA